MPHLFYVSLLIQWLVIGSISLDPEYSVLAFVFIPAAVLSLVGFFYPKSNSKAVAYISMAGFAFFVPIGLLGIVAVRNAMDKEAKDKFERRMKRDGTN